MSADKAFLQGGKLDDFSANITWMIRREVELTAKCQYESSNFPLLAAGARSDVATSFEIRMFPGKRIGSH
jgi:hypothetical protein